MKRLSSAVSEIKAHYDVIVIGSGYGGSITASRMARAGKKVCLLERGKEFQPGEYPNKPLSGAEETQIDTLETHIGKKTGLFDVRVNKEINVVLGCGLGGTSLINANVGMEPGKDVFADPSWPEALRNDQDTFQKAFEAVHSMLKTTPYPDSRPMPSKAQSMKSAAEGMGLADRWKFTPIYVNFAIDGPNHVGVTQKPCIACGDCCSGCNFSAKNTMIMNYLPDAKNHGAEIYTQVNVRYVQKLDRLWKVHYNLLQTGEEKFDAATDFISAEVVVLAAGTLGSTELLLRSVQNGLPCSHQLGEHFTGNGDFLAFGYNNELRANSIGTGIKNPSPFVDPVGPNISSIIDLRNQTGPLPQMVIEEGVVPGLMGGPFSTLVSVSADLEGQNTSVGHADKLRKKEREIESLLRGPYHGAINHTMTYLVMTNDDDRGKMVLENDRLRIEWPGAGGLPIYEKVNERLLKLTEALDGVYTRNPTWTPLFHKQLVTVHPLGGCIMGEDSSTGVVNHKGQVFTGANDGSIHDGLYVSDGSIVPRPLCINPSLTISALAERNCVYMAKDRGWNFAYDFPPIQPDSEPDPKPAIEFTEKMTGFISVPSANDDYNDCYKEGVTLDQTCEFVLTIRSADLEEMLIDSKHEAHIIGTLSAPLLSPFPMSVNNGVFNLFVADEDHVDTRLMKYELPVTTQNDQKYFLRGFKAIHDDPGFDLWTDTTTLFTTIYEGSASGKVIAKGILKIKPADLIKQLGTLKVFNVNDMKERIEWEARFGKYFAGVMVETYGSVILRTEHFNPDAPARQMRPLRVGQPEVIPVRTDDGIGIRLTRYNGGKRGPVMLIHGLGVSSRIFSTDTIETNLLEFLYAYGYDLWLLDYRASIDLPASRSQFTGDEIAQYDYPAAVKSICEQTGVNSIDVIAHCFGATTFSMSLLSGLKGVRSLVLSQIGPNVIAAMGDRIKSGLHIPGLLEEFGVQSMNCYTDVHADWKNRLYDKLLQLTGPVGENRTSDAVSNRISFTYGQLYELKNLNETTFETLHELFGIANIDSLKHLALMIREKKIVSAKSEDIYLPHLAEGMNLPITFIHGSENKCFLPESTQITFEELKRLNPTEQYSRKVIPGYGHIDCIFGKNAFDDVYPYILDHLESIQ